MEEIDQHLIEHYLANSLSETERADFERRRKEDAMFNQAVEDYEYAKEALIIKERDALRGRIKGWDQDLDSVKQDAVTPKKLPLFWLVLMGILLLSVLLWWFVFSPDRPSSMMHSNGIDTTRTNTPPSIDSSTLHQTDEKYKQNQGQDKKQNEQKPPMADALKKGGELFAENFSPYKNNAMSPDARGDNVSPIDQFRKSYWDGQYKEAIKIFSRLGQAYQNNDNLRFVYAISLAADDKTEVAQLELENIIRHKKSIYLEEASWYLGLMYLKQGDIPNAKTYFQKCVNSPQGYNKNEAVKILEKMK